MPRNPSSDDPKAPVEGPVPPGVDAPPAASAGPAVPDPSALSADELRAKTDELGVTPERGSGAGGNVVRADLEAAVEGVPAPPPVPDPPAGRPPLAAVAEGAAAHLTTTAEEG
jgi:hypothetical protein